MREFLKDIKDIIKNPIELDCVLKRTEKLYDVIFKEMENLANYKEEEMSRIEAKQDEQDKKMDELELKMKDLVKEMYGEEGDFEIVCPYCNCEFELDLDEGETEIVCPECTNIIELDWDETNFDQNEEN